MKATPPRPLSVCVCGAGPTGLAAAILLRRQGHAVTVVERFGAPAPVGSGLMLQPTGLAVLEALGLGPEMASHGARLTRLVGKTSDAGRTVLDVGYDALGPGAHALAVHRSALFGILYEVAKAEGADFETGFTVASAGDGVVISDRGRRLGAFDLVIDALGSKSPLAGLCGPLRKQTLAFGALWGTVPWLGEPFLADALEQRYRAASIMVGVLPVGRRHGETAPLATFFWSLKAADYAAWRERGLDAWKAEVLEHWPQVEPILAHISSPDDLALARYGHHTLARPAAPRLAVIGDAAHSTSPQLGQGANMGLLDAWALAASVEQHADLSDALAAYARARRWHVRLYQGLSQVFTPFYQSDAALWPGLRDWLLAPATRVPGVPRLLAAMVAGQIGSPLRRLRLSK
ncbi:MAG: FAD-dependent oxidoreductase [Caulobacteraceae bacterium]